VAYMLRGPLARLFWFGAVFGGIALPIHLLALHLANPGSLFLPAMAAVLSLMGLLAFEDCYIRAGQALPLS